MRAPADATLLDALRARLWAGAGIAEAARACGVSRDKAKGLVGRWGRGEPPAQPGAPTIILHAPEPGLCHYPLSDGRPWRFCSQVRARGSMYCAEHLRLCIAGHTRPESWLR